MQLDQLIEGLGRTYRKARKAFREAYREPSDESFHAWRKRVQLHWRHMALLSRGWPEAMSARSGEAKELSRLLGEDHDLTILREHVEQRPELLKRVELELLVALIGCRQDALRSEALAWCVKLVAEHQADWLKDLKEALAGVEKARAKGPQA